MAQASGIKGYIQGFETHGLVSLEYEGGGVNGKVGMVSSNT